MPEHVPPEIEGFTFQHLIGRGGFSDVYLYRQQMPGRDVAIKVLRTEAVEEVGRTQFAAEANLMARVSSHTAIASIFTADVDDEGEPYLVMEYCPGGSLGDTFRSSPLSVPRTLRLGVRLASALESAHRAGIVHRDVKPSNVLVTEYGVAVLTDFGISTIDEEFPEATLARAQVYSEGIEDSTAVGMSLPWAAPESLASPPVADTRSDRFSLAATLYSLLEGRSPREVPQGPNGATAIRARIRTGFIAQMQRPDAPESLQELLRRGMAYDPAARFESCLEMARALQRVQRELGLEVTPVEVPGVEDLDDLDGGARLASGGPGAGSSPGTGTAGVDLPASPAAPAGESTWLPAGQTGVAPAATGAPPAGTGAPPAGTGAPPAGTGALPAAQNGVPPVGAQPAPHPDERVELPAPPLAQRPPAPAAGPGPHTPSGLVSMAPTHAGPAPRSERSRRAERIALAAAVVFVVVGVVAGASWLINVSRHPHFTGAEIDNLTITDTSAGAYEISVPEGLELPEDLQVRVLDQGDGDVLGEHAVATVSTDETTWSPGEAVTLNPWASDVAGEDVFIPVDDLRSQLHLDSSTDLRPGTVLLALAPRAYFANRTPDLEITAGESVLALVTIVP